MTQFFGKYRGKVENNIDPMGQARLQVSCPAVLGDGRLAWAMPSVPYAGPSVGFVAIPPMEANVWVEFEAGNSDQPIWSGCFWDLGGVTALSPLPATKIWKTDAITITVNDLPGAGGVTIEVNPPAVATPLKMTFDSSGITLANGANKVALTLASVSINDGALEVI
jgi:hypothetical protein